jgi:ubiquinone/menaquinone biosynthesis C-methylase UbiE
MTGKEAKLDRTYARLNDDDALTLLNEHYGVGINGYCLWAEIPTALKAWWRGLENVPDHPAQLHYAWLTNEDGSPRKIGLNEGIRSATSTALELLQLDYNKPITLLDAGCGVGGAVLQIDRMLQDRKVADTELHGISIISKQIKVGRLRCMRFGAINARLIVGDCLNLPYKSDYFDGIIAIETFCHIDPEAKPSLLQGLFRVLAPGGRMVILDGYKVGEPKSPEEGYWLNIFRNGLTLPELVTSEDMDDLAVESGFELEQSFSGIERVRRSAKLIHRRVKYIGKPLLRIYGLLKNLGHESKLLQKTGIHTPNAESFLEAGFAQKVAIDRGWLTYHVHVLRRPHHAK